MTIKHFDPYHPENKLHQACLKYAKLYEANQTVNNNELDDVTRRAWRYILQLAKDLNKEGYDNEVRKAGL